jgi:hypothetical protein
MTPVEIISLFGIITAPNASIHAGGGSPLRERFERIYDVRGARTQLIAKRSARLPAFATVVLRSDVRASVVRNLC